MVEKDQSFRSGTQRRDSALLSGNFASREAWIAIQLEAPFIWNARRTLRYHLLTLIDCTIPSSEDDPFCAPQSSILSIGVFLSRPASFSLPSSLIYFRPLSATVDRSRFSPISGSFIGPCESVRSVFVAFWPFSAFNVHCSITGLGGLVKRFSVSCANFGVFQQIWPQYLQESHGGWRPYKLVLTSCRICSWKTPTPPSVTLLVNGVFDRWTALLSKGGSNA